MRYGQAAGLAILFLCSMLMAPRVRAQPAGEVARGNYLVTQGDCVVCHTAPVAEAKPYAGGYPLHAIFGTVYSTNITPDKQTGIGSWTADQFYRAMHDGIAADGRHLYPAFPYAYFRKISRSDTDAIFAYLRTLPAVHQRNRQNKLIFPANIRWFMTFWDWMFTPQSPFKHDPSQSAVWNRGGEIVNGMGHCGGCHTPKNFLFANKSDKFLQGEVIDGWYAPNLTGSPRTGLGKWSAADIAQYLKTGENRYGWVVGSMRDVVRLSSSRWTDADRFAVATYLKSLPAEPEAEPKKPAPAAMQSGQAVFVARCSVCHSARNKDYPSLAENSLVNAPNATTLLHVILEGSQSASVPNQPAHFSMPGFPVLTNTELADVANYLRNSWGNHAGAVSPADAAKVRSSLKAAE